MEVRKIAKKTITVIEPKQALLVDKAKYQQTRMAAYCRVSTDSAEQKTSYETQKQVYTDMIARRKDWTMVGIYADEGISGTRADKRPEFNKMIKDCLAGTEILINPSGCFNIGGPEADAGLTGRKIMVDTYGGLAAHGSGAFSGKDATKVDRSGAYMARYIAKNLVKAGLADCCQVGISYAIGKAEPLAVSVESFGTSNLSDEELAEIVTKVFDLRPAAIIERFDLKKPIYKKTSAYGHFNSADFPWEAENAIQDILTAEKKRNSGIF